MNWLIFVFNAPPVSRLRSGSWPHATGNVTRSWGGNALFDVSTTYDAAGRPVEIRDSGVANRLIARFVYDGAGTGLGRLMQATRFNYHANRTWAVSEKYEYNGRDGRVSKRTTCLGAKPTLETADPCGIAEQTFSQEFIYNDLGTLNTLKYPLCTVGCGMAAPVRDQTFGYSVHDGSLTSVTGFATSITYHPSGIVNAVASSNGVTTTTGAGAFGMARPSSIATTSVAGGAGNWSSGTYGYDGSGNIKAIGSNKFVYDKVNRLTEGSATVNGSILVQSYQYDSLGNRSVGTTAATNRLSSAAYDDAGNMTTNAGFTYTWDGTNAMTTLAGMSKNERYLYNAAGERIGSWDGNLSKWTWRFRDGGAKVIREFTSTGGTWGTTTWTWQKDYIHRDGSLLAAVTPTGTRYMHLDHLGTPRLITTATRVGEAHSYYPFGQEATFVSYDAEPMKFTGHERDDRPPGATQNTDYLDYMHARYLQPDDGEVLIRRSGAGCEACTSRASVVEPL